MSETKIFLFSTPTGQDLEPYLQDLFAQAQPTAADGIMAGQIVRSQIVERTSKGVDSDNNAFIKYSDSYAKKKVKMGGNASPVNLFSMIQRPHMMNTIQVKSGSLVDDPQGGSVGIIVGGMDPINNFDVGIYGTEEAERAEVHNKGARISVKGSKVGAKSGKRYKIRVSKKTGKTLGFGLAEFAMPVRHFFDVNSQDIELMEQVIVNNMEERLKSKL